MHSIHPIDITERMGAATHLISSLEYLVRKQDRQRGGLNHWELMRPGFPDSLRKLIPVYDFFASEKNLRLLHGSRALVSALLLAPPSTHRFIQNNGFRAILNTYLALSQFAIYPRHFYGTDGSDQVAFIIQSASSIGRAAHPFRGKDHAAAFIGAQIATSYCAAGLAKLPGTKWCSGEALPLIMRTQTYGDPWLYSMLRKYPLISRVLNHTTLVVETIFPIFFFKQGKAITPALIFMGLFHLANARFMGLSRFAIAFIGTYPCVRSLAKGELTSGTRKKWN